MFLAFCAALAALPFVAAEKPNVLAILVDDWGYANVGIHRGKGEALSCGYFLYF